MLHVDLVRGGHALVQLVQYGGQHHFQAGHGKLGLELLGVEAIFSEGLDDVPDVDQMHWEASGEN